MGSKPVGTYQANGRVEQIVISGDTAYLAGQFTSMRPFGAAAGTGEVTRNHVAAVNIQTGALLPWNPNANNTVQSLVVSGNTVYLVGLFTTVGGHNNQRLAAVDATTGAASTTFKGSTNAQVMSIALSNGVLYAGGEFTQAGTATRSHRRRSTPPRERSRRGRPPRTTPSPPSRSRPTAPRCTSRAASAGSTT